MGGAVTEGDPIIADAGLREAGPTHKASTRKQEHQRYGLAVLPLKMRIVGWREEYRRLPLAFHPVRIDHQIKMLRRLQNPPAPLRLHLGCGKRHLDGFVNIDVNFSAATDYVCDITRLPCRPGTVERIETYHAIEHLPHPSLPRTLAHWYTTLAPGGTFIVECPHFDDAVREYLGGDSDRIYNIFGLQRFRGDAHLFGFNPERLTAMLKEAGFSTVTEAEPLDHHVENEPCMRLEATK